MKARTFTHHGTMTSLVLPATDTRVVRLHLSKDFAAGGDCSPLLLAFYAEMLSRGSKRYSKTRFDELLEATGAQVAFSTEGQVLTLSVTVRRTHLRTLLTILADALKAPLFLSREIEKVRKEFLQALQEEEDNARARAYALFTRQIYERDDQNYIPTRPLRMKEIERLVAASLRAIHARSREAYTVLSVAGSKADHDLCVRLLSHTPSVRRAVKTLLKQPSLRPAAIHTETLTTKPNIELFIGNRLPLRLKDPDFLAFLFGIEVLGRRGGFAGRLMKTVREKEGLTYMIYAWIRGITTTHYGHWNISTFFTPKDVEQGLQSTMREVRLITKRGITKDELSRFKEILTNHFKLSHESNAATLSLLHRALVSGRTLEDVYEYPQKVAMLTKESVDEALRQHLSPDKLIVAAVGPVEGTVLKKK